MTHAVNYQKVIIYGLRIEKSYEGENDLQAHISLHGLCRSEPLAELAKEGIRTLYIDVTDMASIQKAVGAVLDENKRIDLLVCNAGKLYKSMR